MLKQSTPALPVEARGMHVGGYKLAEWLLLVSLIGASCVVAASGVKWLLSLVP